MYKSELYINLREGFFSENKENLILDIFTSDKEGDVWIIRESNNDITKIREVLIGINKNIEIGKPYILGRVISKTKQYDIFDTLKVYNKSESVNVTYSSKMAILSENPKTFTLSDFNSSNYRNSLFIFDTPASSYIRQSLNNITSKVTMISSFFLGGFFLKDLTGFTINKYFGDKTDPKKIREKAMQMVKNGDMGGFEFDKLTDSLNLGDFNTAYRIMNKITDEKFIKSVKKFGVPLALTMFINIASNYLAKNIDSSIIMKRIK